MEQTGIQEILKALQLHSAQLDKKLEDMKVYLEKKLDKGFDRIETKLSNYQIELSETQETVDYLAIKVAQHEKKLRYRV